MPRRARLVTVLAGIAALGAGRCGSGGVASDKLVAALGLKSSGQKYTMEGNPFCSIRKLLTDSSAVHDASSSGKVIASRDGTVGVQVITPFAPACEKKARRKLDKLAKKEGK